jgi:PTH1 family peptidyl-tRNA hydrolase
VRYWINKEKIQPENLLVVADDLSLPLGKIRLKGQGSGGGHNGLENIIQTLCSQQFARLRFGIGNDFPMGAQIKFVLDAFDEEEKKIVDERIPVAVDVVKNFCLTGIDETMCKFNNK